MCNVTPLALKAWFVASTIPFSAIHGRSSENTQIVPLYSFIAHKLISVVYAIYCTLNEFLIDANYFACKLVYKSYAKIIPDYLKIEPFLCGELS